MVLRIFISLFLSQVYDLVSSPSQPVVDPVHKSCISYSICIKLIRNIEMISDYDNLICFTGQFKDIYDDLLFTFFIRCFSLKPFVRSEV